MNQPLEEYEAKKEDLVPYHRCALRLLDRLDIVRLEHVPRGANKMADALASLAATLALEAEEEMTILVCSCWVVPPDAEIQRRMPMQFVVLRQMKKTGVSRSPSI